MSIDVKFFAEAKNAWATDIHPTQPWLLTADSDGITLYNLESGKVIHTLSGVIWTVKFIARKSWYIVGSGDGNLRVFDCNTHKEVIAFQSHQAYPVCCLAVHPTAPIVLTGSGDKTIKAWDWDRQWRNIQTYQGHTNWIRSINFNPNDLNTFASASDDKTVRMWSIASPTPHRKIEAHDKVINYVDFYPGIDKPYLLTASFDGTIKVWDYPSQTCIQTIQGHTSGVIFSVFHPILPIILSGGYDGALKIWNSETYEIEDTIRYKYGWARCITLRKDTNKVALGFDKAVLILELANTKPLQMETLKGDIGGETPKEQAQTFVEGRDTEHGLQLAQSLDGLTTTHETTLSLTPPSTSPAQLHGVHHPELDPYQRCTTMMIELMAAKTTNKLVSELRGDNAQHVADLLSKMASEKETFTQHERKHTLHLLSKLAKSAVVFPRHLVLKGARCNLASPFAWGGYGVIYKGEYERSPICIKAVQADSQGIDERKLRAHASELTIWANLDHPNVLPFLGIYSSKEEVPRICIVSPWMTNGDLLQYLGKVPDAPRKPLVRDILSGLQYLHDLDIIHADLKAKNVLVSEGGKAMLADFGISRLSITLTTILTNVSTGTVYWMAPELHLDDEPSPSRETDIWAFACTCYEIITGMMPFGHYRNPAILIGAFFRGKIVPEKPTPGIGWDEDVWSVAMRCWQRDPASRPRAHELLDMINGFDFPDNRPSESESKKNRNSVEIDYDRILIIFNEIRQSTGV